MITLLASETVFGSPIRGEWIGVIAVSGGLLTAMIGIVAGTVGRIVKVRATEQSRREIAAYVAEGSMSPQDAERILDAGMPRWERPQRC